MFRLCRSEPVTRCQRAWPAMLAWDRRWLGALLGIALLGLLSLSRQLGPSAGGLAGLSAGGRVMTSSGREATEGGGTEADALRSGARFRLCCHTPQAHLLRMLQCAGLCCIWLGRHPLGHAQRFSSLMRSAPGCLGLTRLPHSTVLSVPLVALPTKRNITTRKHKLAELALLRDDLRGLSKIIETSREQSSAADNALHARLSAAELKQAAVSATVAAVRAKRSQAADSTYQPHP
jgi:hypothetical protein